jgi:hypothetical protein
MEAEKLKRVGYKILRIRPIALPKPNSRERLPEL